MTGMEIALLVIGCVFMVGSFFVSEKLSGKEMNRIAALSDDELKKIIRKAMNNAENQIDTVVENKVDEVAEKVEIALERESNMKIMAINEYSDTVIDSMNKTHDEIMFLYSMLNDKHKDMTSMTGDLQRLAANIRNLQEDTPKPAPAPSPAPASSPTTSKRFKATKGIAASNDDYLAMAAAAKEEYESVVNENGENTEFSNDAVNHNDKIMELHKEGLSKVEIAKRLDLGVGEVSLVIGLYRGEV